MTEEEKQEKKEEMEKLYGKAPAIDLSKIKNAGADRSITKAIEKATATAKKNRFHFTEEYEIKVPTLGKLYQEEDDEDVKAGIVKMRPMTLSDEAILANKSFADNGTTFKHLLENCVLNNINVKHLNPYDVIYMLYQLREITYGGDYEFELTCPKCGAKINNTVDIHEVEWKTLDSDAESVRTVKLPVSKFTVTLRSAQLGDTEDASRIKNKYNADDVILNYIVRTLEILDDNNVPINPNEYGDFYEELPAKDAGKLTDLFSDLDDLNIPTVTIKCPKCDYEEEMQIPFSEGFFGHK